jgi:hypothetical protein
MFWLWNEVKGNRSVMTLDCEIAPGPLAWLGAGFVYPEARRTKDRASSKKLKTVRPNPVDSLEAAVGVSFEVSLCG